MSPRPIFSDLLTNPPPTNHPDHPRPTRPDRATSAQTHPTIGGSGPTGTAPRLAPLAAGAFLLATLAGCGSGLDPIDAKIQKLIANRTSILDGGTIEPTPRLQPAEGSDRPEQNNTQPETINPPPEQLRYAPADEARDVAGRLDAYAAGAIGSKKPDAAPAPGGMSLGIVDAFRVAQRSAREFLTAEEEYILSAISLLIERHNWEPRFFNDTSLSAAGSGDDGRFETALRLVNELRATQRLPYGGEVEARWVWDATEQLREQATGQYRQSSLIAVDASIPLLRDAGLIAREDLIQAERNLVYAARDFEDFRRRLLVNIATDFFDLLELQAQIANQERQLEGALQQQEATEAKVQAGRLAAFQSSIVENQALQSRATLAGLREQYILAVDRFKVRLGLAIEQPVEILPLSLELVEPDVSIEDATRAALLYRLDLQTRRDRVDDARRAVKNARNQLLPDLEARAGVSIPTDPDAREGGLAFDPEELDWEAGVTFGLPLDRKQERLRLRSQIIELQQAQRELDEFRDTIVLNVRRAVRNIDLSRFQLTLADQAVEINRRRLEEQLLKQDEIDAQTLVDTRNELLQAENARDSAVTNLRTAVLNYLLESGQLRVARDGSFQRLPGMEDPDAPPAPEAADAPAGGVEVSVVPSAPPPGAR